MKSLTALLATLILVGCGGGGGGGGNPAVATGQFTDSPVKGLQYRTASQSGETGTNGEFRYLPGETVTFFVGDITVGAAVGAAKMTPFDLAGIAPPATIPNSGLTTVAFDQAINLAVFLQTLDADGNPANGIEIPAQIRTLTSGLTLDFKLKRDTFSRTLALRKLVGAGRTAGLWGGVNAIRTPTRAIKAMYASLGLIPVMDVVSKVEAIDPNSSKLLFRQTTTFDTNGNATRIALEQDNNGVMERSTLTLIFDANGNAAYSEMDANGDGKVDIWTNTTFNVNGDPTLAVSEYDNNGDGTVDRLLAEWMTYNADGYVTGVRIEYDNNNDGVVDSFSTETRSYDTKGNLALTETDANGDGTVDSRSRYTNTYDANGRVTLSEEDSNGDGIVDIRTTYAYDAHGHGILTEIDTNADGIVDQRLSFVYDANGNRIRRDRDGNADGIIDFRIVYTYDVNGYLTLTEDDVGADGIVDQQTTYVYLKTAG